MEVYDLEKEKEKELALLEREYDIKRKLIIAKWTQRIEEEKQSKMSQMMIDVKNLNMDDDEEGEEEEEEKKKATADQNKVMEMVLQGNVKYVLIEGEAGVGKSYTLQRVIHAANITWGRNCAALTAYTGIAAKHIDGITIHSFLGLSINNFETLSVEQIITKTMRRPSVLKQLEQTKVLLIDEFNMMDAYDVDMMDRLLRSIRKQPNQPFGGMKMVMSADLLQLPPIISATKENLLHPYKSPYFFSANYWPQVMKDGSARVKLTTPFRTKDVKFFNMLSCVQKGDITSEQFVRELEIPVDRDDKSQAMA